MGLDLKLSTMGMCFGMVQVGPFEQNFRVLAWS